MSVLSALKANRLKQKKLGAYRATNVLDLIHTNICGPFHTPAWNGQQYFVSFIDDHSRYAYLFLSMKSLKSWTCSNHLRSKLRINSTNELKMSNLTVEVNTIVDMMFQVNNVQDHLPNT